MADNANSYDEVPYQGGPFRQSQPRHLATLATLFGLTPPGVDRCRVLELGCAEGGNLIPNAVTHPESDFLGIDYSERQIAVGREIIARLKLPNIRLVHGNILDIDRTLGEFDYIIAHGVYSWVPDDVREKLLAICRNHLHPQGVAYVSYNTYPGGRLRQMVRDMMLYRVRNTTDLAQAVPQARALLDFLVESAPASQIAYRSVLEWEQRHVRPFADHQVRHDSLSEVNDPCYFWQFVERAERQGLQYLAEANFSMMLPRNFPAAVFEKLKQMSKSVVEMEQYMDFARNRCFRETLLCHREVRIDRAVSPDQITKFFIGSSLRPVSPTLDLHNDREEAFRNTDGSEIRVSAPLTKAALACLGEIWPRNEAFTTLIQQSAALLTQSPNSALRQSAAPTNSHPMPDAKEVQGVARTLLECYAAGLIELDVRPTACVSRPGDRPSVPAFNRLQAETGDIVTNQRHESIRLDPVQRALLPHLDGRHDRRQLLDAVSRIVPATEKHRAGEKLEAALNGLAGAAVLTAPFRSDDS